ncbi:MAG: AAA family ATPase, partial [Magnetospiraceae bacterium]
ADTPVRDLSGGEKARLVLALLSRFAPHLLLLDEPTNHLDVDARDALIQALNAFTGAVILVSHDAHLVEAVCDRLWLVDDGTCTVFDGDLADYEKQLLSRRRGGDSGTSDRSEAATKKDARRNRAESRAKLAPLRDAARKADKALEKLTAQRAALEARLAEPSLYDGPAEAVSDLQRELGQLDKDIATVEETWMAAHEALEAASETD